MGTEFITATELDSLVGVKGGKVRDIYDAGDGCPLIVATDRISGFDVVLPTAIPDKRRVLTQFNGAAAGWGGGSGANGDHDEAVRTTREGGVWIDDARPLRAPRCGDASGR